MDQSTFDVLISQPPSDEKQEARACFLPHALQLQFKDRTLEHPWSQLRMELAGFKQQLLFVELPGGDGSFYLEKSRALHQVLESIQDPRGLAFSKGMRAGERQSLGLILLFVLLVLGSLCGLWATQDSLIKGAAALVTSQQEKLVGENVLKIVVPNGQRITDPKLLASLDQLMLPLFQANGIDPKSITMILSRDRQMNAFAFMGGYLVFNRGLISQADSSEEFLGVAAHELAHITQRHSLRSAIKGIGIYTILSLVLSDMTGLLAVLADQGSFLLQQGYSRDFEREADAFGFDYLLRAGVNPKGLLTFFKKINEKSFLENFSGESETPKTDGESETPKADGTFDKVLSMVSTHPMTAERIENLEGRLSEISEEKKAALLPLAFDWKEFQRLVAADSL